MGINALLPSRYFMFKQNQLENNNLYYHPWFLGETNNKKNSLNIIDKHNYIFKHAPSVFKEISECF